jgi:hypothetical protein
MKIRTAVKSFVTLTPGDEREGATASGGEMGNYQSTQVDDRKDVLEKV